MRGKKNQMVTFTLYDEIRLLSPILSGEIYLLSLVSLKMLA